VAELIHVTNYQVCSLVRAFVCGRASESTIIGLIIPESATGIVTTFDICRFQGVTALALTTLWKPWVFVINICGFSFV
jgi:hypothetical protein